MLIAYWSARIAKISQSANVAAAGRGAHRPQRGTRGWRAMCVEGRMAHLRQSRSRTRSPSAWTPPGGPIERTATQAANSGLPATDKVPALPNPGATIPGVDSASGATGQPLMLVVGRAAIGEHLRSLHGALARGRKRGPGAVHDARGAIRRLRVVLAVLSELNAISGAARLQRRLSQVDHRIAALRVFDVFLRDIAKGGDQAETSERKRAGGARKRACRRLARTLDSGRTRRLLRTLAKIAEHEDEAAPTHLPSLTVRDYAGSMVLRGCEHIQALVGDLPSLPRKRSRRLRIDVRRMRYQLELVRAAMGTGADPLIATLAEAQDRLGDLHDARAALDMEPTAARAQRCDELSAALPAALAPLMSRRFRTAVLSAIAVI